MLHKKKTKKRSRDEKVFRETKLDLLFCENWQREQMGCCEVCEAAMLTGCQRSLQCFLSPALPPSLPPSSTPVVTSPQKPLRQTDFHSDSRISASPRIKDGRVGGFPQKIPPQEHARPLSGWNRKSAASSPGRFFTLKYRCWGCHGVN